jgi:hypothetical protein
MFVMTSYDQVLAGDMPSRGYSHHRPKPSGRTPPWSVPSPRVRLNLDVYHEGGSLLFREPFRRKHNIVFAEPAV